jgi:dTDP-4-dehydrorhamnose reductase
VQAVTAWALLGTYDWNSLLTRKAGHYEVGAFDVRGPKPRPTALAAELARLGRGEGAPHPATAGPGWWRRDIRLEFQPVLRTVETPQPRPEWRPAAGPGRPLLIVGGTGTLGQALARACEWRGIAYRLTRRSELELAEDGAIERILEACEPWAVVNAAGWVRVDEAEREAAACLAANADGAVRLARAARDAGLPFAGFSSDLVFDGRTDRPYVESDAPAPLNVYGASKARAEAEVLDLGGVPLMIRTAAFFSPYDPYNFAAALVRALIAGEPFEAAEDLVISPTYVPDLADAALDLLIDGETGLRHLANADAVSWAEFARRLSSALDLDGGLIRGRAHRAFGWPARRPAYAALGTERGQVMPDLDQAIARHAAIVAEAEFAPEAEALAEGGGPPDLFERAAPRVS